MLPNDRTQANSADIGWTKIGPIPGIHRVIDVDLAPVITVVSNDSNIVFRN